MFLLGALFAVGLGFTACSSDKDVAENPDTIENGGGNYIAISINLPNNPATNTRTDDNGGNVGYNDGLASEYAVKNATLIIFDASGNYVEAREIDPKPWTTSSDDNVTRVSTKVVQKVDGSIAANHQMLVILNHNDLIKVSGTNTLQVWNGSSFENFSGTFSAFQALTTAATTTGLNCGKMDDSGFYMANALLADKQGSTATDPAGATVRVLVPITQVYSTEAAAAAGTADEIYVERGMAKVTMEQTITTDALSNSKIDGTTTLKGTVTGWTLDNCNPVSYLVRDVSSSDNTAFLALKSNSTATGAAVYRYIGNTAITQGSPTTYKYRTYFSKSANYDKSTSLNRVSTSTTFSDKFGDTNPQYCFENTFSVSDQDVNKTTLVQVAIQAIAEGGSAADLYTVNGNKSSIYTLSSLKTLIQSKALEYIESQSGWVTSGSISSTDITVGDITVDANNKVTAIVLTYSGSAIVDATKFYKDGTGSNKTLVDAVYENALTETGDILKYTNGISYYNIRIKHFGDLLTPWKNNETPQPSTTGGVYPTTNANANYLGRYGVLRNNWYNLKVNAIKSLGEAVPHTANWPDTPDDDMDNYITFQINVLSWAKHQTQNADL